MIRVPFLQHFCPFKHNMYDVKSVNSNVTVGKWSLRMFKTQFNVCFLSSRFMWVPVSSFLCPLFCLGDCFLCSWREKRWLVVHPLWLLHCKVAVLLWWCHLSDWSNCAFSGMHTLASTSIMDIELFRIGFSFLFVLRQIKAPTLAFFIPHKY